MKKKKLKKNFLPFYLRAVVLFHDFVHMAQFIVRAPMMNVSRCLFSTADAMAAAAAVAVYKYTNLMGLSCCFPNWYKSIFSRMQK